MATCLQLGAPMSLPREIVPGRLYMITRRTTQRQLLLRPDDETNQIFLYCLAEAAERYGIEVVLPSVLSNHHHTIVRDPHGNISDFVGHLHKYVAKVMNDLRGRDENFWSNDEPSIVWLVDAADVMDKLVYAATNPVKDHLVERVDDWPGVNGLSALLEDRVLEAERPRRFFRSEGPMPATVTLRLTIPAELGDPDEVRRTLRERVLAFEQRVTAERARTGRAVLGRRGVLRQSWQARPTSVEARRKVRPRLAARDSLTRKAAQRRDHEFQRAYREAWRRWRAGLPTVFPPGTYWLRRYANVPVAASPSAPCWAPA